MAMGRAIGCIRKGKGVDGNLWGLLKWSRAQSQTRASSTRTSNSNYVSDMRKSAIDANMLRLLRNEIDYELHRSRLHQGQRPPAEINGFKVGERPGEQWISLEKQFRDIEEIKLEVTMFDGPFHVPKAQEKEIQLQNISMIVTIFKKTSNHVLEFICSAWPDTIEISNLFVRQRAELPNNPYTGPNFRELDDELQDSLYEFLEERGIDDSLCIFLQDYVNYKVEAEYICWMKSVKSVMEI